LVGWLDTNNNGSIDLHEFVANLLDLMHQSTNASEKKHIRKLVQDHHQLRCRFMKFVGFAEKELRVIRDRVELLQVPGSAQASCCLSDEFLQLPGSAEAACCLSDVELAVNVMAL